MAGNYHGTSIEFTDETLEEFRKEVLQTAYLGDPNSGFGEKELQNLAERYNDICVRIKSMIAAYGLSHRGPDSDAAQTRLGGLVTLGENGIAKLRNMAVTLSQQTPAFKQMHDQLEPLTTMDHSLSSGSTAVAGPPLGTGSGGLPPYYAVGGGGDTAVGGQRLIGILERNQAQGMVTDYQVATNQILETAIPVFEPPPAQQFGTGQGPSLTTTGVGGGPGAPAVGANAASLAPAQVMLPPEVAGAPGGAAGVGPAGVGAAGLGPGGVGPGGAAPGGVGNLAPGQQTAPVAPLAPAADLGRRSTQGTSPVTPGLPGSPGGSATGIGTYPRSSAGLGGVDDVSSRGLPAGGVIRPEVSRGGVPAGEPASPRPRPGGTIVPEGEARSAIPRGNTAGPTHQPMMPAAGMGAGRGGSTRRRPDWLIEPDPDSYWLTDVPPHLPGVLRPTDDFDDC